MAVPPLLEFWTSRRPLSCHLVRKSSLKYLLTRVLKSPVYLVKNNQRDLTSLHSTAFISSAFHICCFGHFLFHKPLRLCFLICRLPFTFSNWKKTHTDNMLCIWLSPYIVFSTRGHNMQVLCRNFCPTIVILEVHIVYYSYVLYLVMYYSSYVFSI